MRLGIDVNRESAGLASIGVVGEDLRSEQDLADEYVLEYPSIPIDSHTQSVPMAIGGDASGSSFSGTTPLIRVLNQDLSSTDLEANYGTSDSSKPSQSYSSSQDKWQAPKSENQNLFVRAASYLPAVFLGTLLNVLDALSYGMIMFPIGEAIFAQMAPAGLSMFYISTVVSQLVYSCGGSALRPVLVPR